MKDRLLSDLRLWAVLLVIAFFVATLPALADDDRHGPSVDVDTDVDISTPVDVSVPVNTDIAGDSNTMNSTSKSLALVNSLGDVDIAGCLGSTQWATPLFSKQKLVLNWPCLAEFYLRNGQYELAAMAICNTEVVKEFDSEDACEAAHDFSPPPQPVPGSYIPEELYQQDQLLSEQLDQLQARVESIEQKPAATRTVVERQPVREVVEQKPAFDADAVWAAWKGDSEDED